MTQGCDNWGGIYDQIGPTEEIIFRGYFQCWHKRRVVAVEDNGWGRDTPMRQDSCGELLQKSH